MSKLIYVPEDGERQEFDFDPTGLMSVDAEAIEEAGGNQWETYGEFIDKLQRGSQRAWRAALWIMLRQQNPTLQFVHLVVKVNEIIWIEDDDEEDEPGKEGPVDNDTDSPSVQPDSPPDSEN